MAFLNTSFQKLSRYYLKGKFRGQKQKWFIVRFTGNESEINLRTRNPEFIEWKWICPDQLPEVIVDFKKDLYLKLLKN